MSSDGLEQLGRLAGAVASRLSGEASKDRLTVSVAPMRSTRCISIEVPLAGLAAFLTELGGEAAAAGIDDVQFWLQARTSKRTRAATEIWGLVIDLDREVDDVLDAAQLAGLPLPAVYWRTAHGWKLVFVWNRSASPDEFTAIAEEMTVALAGADPGSYRIGQGQHLPVCTRTRKDSGLELVEFEAIQLHSRRLQLEDWRCRIPHRLSRMVADPAQLDEAGRAAVEARLEELGISAPDDAGDHRIYARCPEVDQHDTRCCYVNRRTDGSIVVRCLGGSHGGVGRTWTEWELLGDSAAAPATRTPRLEHLAVTWATEQLMRHRVREALAREQHREELVKACVRVWYRACAENRRDDLRRRIASDSEELELDLLPAVPRFVDLFRRRLRGFDGAGAFRPFFDEQTRELHLLFEDRRSTRVNLGRGASLSPKSHRHEQQATEAFGYVPVFTKKGVTVQRIVDPDFTSDWNKALAGHRGCLARLGVPIVRNHRFPVAFTEDGWSLGADGCVDGVLTAQAREGDEDFDVLGFFLGLFREGKLPLASENDVRLFVMALAPNPAPDGTKLLEFT